MHLRFGKMEFVLLLCAAVTLCSGLSPPVEGQQGDDANAFNPRDEKGLFPHIFNLATRGRISVNATCGDRGPETYCKLVEHVPNESEDYPQCRVCNSRSFSKADRHPIWNAIDGTESWWQSPSIANGMQYHWVTITLDLGQIYQVAYVIIKAANSPRPGNWILERSLDGEMYKPWQYFAISDSECVKEYGIVPSRDMHRFSRDDEVTCTSLYSKLEPLENGEIHSSIVNGRPTATNPSQVLIEFTSARFIRLRLQQIRTLHADLMTFYSRGIRYVDPIVSRRYYYSIKDISVGGQCICFGHAEQCILNAFAGPNDMALKCICEHNTCGDQCNQCCRGFQQFPWRPGNADFGNSCRPCNCHGHADDCYYDAKVDAQSLSIDENGNYNGGGVCVGCRDNTDGLNCQTCRDGFYRPLGVEPTDPAPCSACICSLVGTDPESNYNCVKDERSQSNMNPGDCFCKEGYAGPSCDRCARGYRGYPDCEKCECSDAGSSNVDPCEGPCECKPNVEGSNCDTCKRGFFNLVGDNPDGCGQCYCFGITTECTSVPWGIEQVTTLSGWFVTNLERSSYAFPDTTGTDMLAINHYKALEDLGNTGYYWFASTEYLGNKLSSHGGYLTFSVSYSIQRGDIYQQPTRDADVVIEGDRLLLYQSFLYLQPEEERTARIQMAAGNWFVMTSDVDLSTGVMGRRATSEEFMRVLADVRMLLIRASYNTRPRESRLKNVILEQVDRTAVSSSIVASVEQCECPPTYEGLSCESCEYGYRRVNNALYGGICERCDCNNHSPECDAYTGECSQCDHNTYGPHCEYCLNGFYGDATSGLADACQPCACPLMEQGSSFSATCVADDRYGFVCDQCVTGHGGPRCDKCVDGFYGDPMMTGMACKPCSLNCNSNLNTSSPGSCDTVTGACLVCREGTAGENCEKCALGYYGDALQRTCQACQCHEAGSIYPQCDEVSGSCQCRSNVTGRQCDTCSPGHFNLSNEGCQSCDCHSIGSLDDICDVMTGQCRCKLGVSGRSCDQCMAGFWNFGENGCQSCECEQSGGLCDPLTGQCGCPANVIGQRCDSCAPGTWGYNSMFGCKPCNCSDIGSSSQQCDLTTGECRCYKSYEGRQCLSCGFGYYGYPKCRKCRCSRRGRDPSTCRGDLCDCNEDGSCVCKANIQGKKCSKCLKGSFSLQPKLPTGCTSCFCFGITDKCSQADYISKRIDMIEEDASELFVSDGNRLSTTQTGVTHYSAGGGVNVTAARVALRTRHVYWNLPEVFLGNKVTAYGGMIKYKIDYTEPKSTDGWSEARPYLPHIMLVGETHSLVIPVSNLNGKSRPKLELYEHNFLHQGSGIAPTREEFMMVLQDLQAILLPASQTYQTLSSRISSVYMEVGGPRGNDTTSLTVLGIEQCKCPKGYRGTSCEECMPGYVRVQEGPYLGRCELCTCHKHSDVCNDGNGKCKDCQHNTTGTRCHLCAPGFYGDATRGKSNDCQPCGCPLNILSNNFSPLCESASDGGYICTACPRGYSGRYCERCALGYYGNPFVPGGSCLPCGCNEYGSNSTACNSTTGQCHCIAGVTGRSCDECSPRHVITGDGCTSCDDGCTGPLLDALDEMKDDVDGLNTSRFIPPPWPILMRLTDERNQLQDQVDSYNRAVVAANELIASLPNGTNDLSAQTRRLRRKLDRYAGGTELVAMNASDVNLRARLLNEQVNATYKLINETVAVFKDQFFNQGLLPARENAQLINRAMRVLEELRDRSFIEMQVAAIEERRLARMSLNKTSNGYAEMLRDLYAKIAQGKEDLNDFILKLDELLIRCRMADRTTTEAFEFIESANDSSNALQNITDIIKEKKRQSEGDIQEAERLLLAAEDLLRMVNSSFQMSDADHMNLSILLPDLVLRADQSDLDLIELGEEADAATEHAIELHNRSALLENLLLPTQQHAQQSLEAERAYSDMVTAINEAHNASLQAKMMADKAYEKTYGNGSQSLGQQARELRDTGFNQVQHTSSLEVNLQNLTSNLADLKGQIAEVNALQEKASQGIEEIKLALPSLEGDVTGDAQGSINSSARAVNLAKQATDKSAGIIERSAVLKEKLNGIGAKYQAYINATDDIANSVETSARIADEMGMKMDSMRKQALHIDRQRAPMELNLSQLRDKIRHARTEASRINVALLCRGDCARSYKPQASSTAFNALVLNINISSPNNMIFYVGNNISGDYLAVETIEGQVRLSWDLGSGRGEVVHPSNLSANQDWYKVNIERFANTASLKVEDSNQAKTSNGSTVTGFSPEGRNVLDVREDSNLFIGGIPTNFNIPVLSTRSFNGTIGDVIFDDVTIGLWNFKTSEGPGEGSFRSPIVTSTPEPGAYFDGTGYAKLRQPPLWDEYINSLNFDIKTLSENGLLFYSSSEDQSSFLSIEMEAGRLAIKHDLGDGVGILVSQSKINTGEWHAVSINRVRQKNNLFINGNNEGMVKSPGSEVNLQVTGVNFVYVGGVPSDFTIFRNVTNQKFRGCLRKFFLFRSAYQLVSPGSSFGVTHGCSDQTQRSVGFSGYGYVTFPPIPLSRESGITVTFTTLMPNTTILAAGETQGRKRRDVDPDATDISYAIGLMNGRVIVQINNGQGRLTLRSKRGDSPYNDGAAHNVVLVKNDKRVNLIVDDRRVDTGRLSGTELYINAMSPFYIGSSGNLTLSPEFSSLPSFSGCIENLIVMKELLGFEKAASFENVTIGKCGPLTIPQPLLPATPIPPEELETLCYNPGTPSMANTAGRFGSVPGSHLAFQINPQEVAKVFEITIELKTTKKDSLIFYMSDPTENYYAALQLMEGFVFFNFKIGSSPVFMDSDFVIDDGYWHTIEISRNRKTGSLQVDGTKRKRAKSNNGRKNLNIQSPIYIGGLPLNRQSPNIYGDGFDGCIRKFRLNGIDIDLRGTANNSYGVVTCYTNTEPGHYFQGIGHALLANQQQIGSDFQLLIEFRTAQKDGLLFAATDLDGVGVTVIISDHDILLKLYTGRRMAMIPFQAHNNFTVCDYQWHVVQVTEIDGLWQLSVDGIMANNLRGTVRLPGDERYQFYAGGNPLSNPDAVRFKGCIRRLEVNGGVIPVESSVEIVGVVPLECPIV